jgi:hypothetical protein
MTTRSQTPSFDDPIVAEIRQIRADLAREADNDLHTICERARETERQHPECLLKTPPPSPSKR